MKKKIIFSLFICLFALSLVAENGNNVKNVKDDLLINKIQKIEQKKKELLNRFELRSLYEDDIFTDAANKIIEKRKEIDSKPYRTAELQADGTPSFQAVQNRNDNFLSEKNKIINEAVGKLDSKLKLNNLFNEINNDYEKIGSRTISSEDGEITASYEKYDSIRLGWNVNITINNDDLDEVKVKTFVAYEDVTGKETSYFGENGFEEFCDNVDYYENLFQKGKSPLVFNITYEYDKRNGTDSANKSVYKFILKDLKFYNTERYDDENKYWTCIDLKFASDEEQCRTDIGWSDPTLNCSKNVIPVYDISDVGTYDVLIRSKINEKITDIKMLSLGFNPEPVILPAGTDGTYGKKGTYVLFGIWPQSEKTANVTLDTDNPVIINDCYSMDNSFEVIYNCGGPSDRLYKGSDNNYYVEKTIVRKSDDYYYDYDEEPEKEIHYFKLEPVKWRLVTEDYQEKCLLLAENVLYPYDINSNGGRDVYGLGTFFVDAFANKYKNAISSVDVKNDYPEYYDESDFSLLSHLFLLNEKELSSKKYGFQSSTKTDSTRKRKTTDFARITGNYVERYDDNEKDEKWLLSSDNDYGNKEVWVGSNGAIKSKEIDNSWYYDTHYVCEYNCGIVPAFTISREDLLPADVTDLHYTTSDSGVTFTWTNPDNNYFKNILITVGGKAFTFKGTKGATSSQEFTGLKKGVTYNFTIQTVDTKGNRSPGIKLSIVAKDVAPEEVLNVTASSFDKGVHVKWTTPKDLDLSEIIISGESLSKDITKKVSPDSSDFLEIKNLENNKNYTFTIKTKDNAGNISGGISFNIIPRAYFLNKPKLLPVGTDGTYGKEGTYALFGLWPQSKKADEIIIDTSKTENVNGWQCYLGNDNWYYIVKGDVYYKLEPIKWRVVTDNYQGGYLLLAENILDEIEFKFKEENNYYYREDNSEINNDYEKSTVRAYLNSLSNFESEKTGYAGAGFLERAFSPEAINNIRTTTVDNSLESIVPEGRTVPVDENYKDNNTKDKIFLLSEREIASDYFKIGRASATQRMTTGYTSYSSNSSYYSSNSGDMVAEQWWLRSPIYNKENERKNNLAAIAGAGGQTDYIDDTGCNYKHGVVPALTVSPDAMPISDIKNFDYVVGNGKITFRWENPSDADFSKSVLKVGDKIVEIPGIPGEKVTKEITGLEKNKTYKVELKAVSNSGDESRAISIDVVMAKLTDHVVVLPKGTDGTGGTNVTYVLFGDWPQSIKNKNVVIDTSKTININGWKCYLGSDNCYYVKEEAHTRSDHDYYSSGKVFTAENGEKIYNNEEYYFKLEPIKWRLLNDYQGGRLLFAEQALANCPYFDDTDEYRNIREINDNNFVYSTMRAFLNGLDGTSYRTFDYKDKGFLQKAFSVLAQNNIMTVTLNNGGGGSYYEDYSDSNDKIFILNSDEIKSNIPISDSDSDYSARKRTVTDYAVAKGIEYSDSWGRSRECQWFTRSPRSGTSNYQNTIDGDGKFYLTGCYDSGCGTVPALVIYPDVIPLPEIENLQAQISPEKINLSWKNPDDSNLSKVIISGNGIEDIVINEGPGVTVSKVITDFPKDDDFEITISTVAKSGKKSIGKVIGLTPVCLTNEPVILPVGTDGSGGTEETYVLFGDWPQSIKPENVKINESISYDVNGWTCYLGDDNCCYTKSKVIGNEGHKFSNGTEIEKDKEYYFMIEPIKWRFVSGYKGEKLLLAEKALDSLDFYSTLDEKRTVLNNTIYGNNYKYSKIRAYLNSLDGSDYNVDNFEGKGFIDKAFTNSALSKLKEVEIDNSANTTRDYDNNLSKAYDYVCENTFDKVFLLSENEITNSEYGFAGYKIEDDLRARKITDYSKAMDCEVFKDGDEESCWWWLRSPNNDVNHARAVTFKGNAYATSTLNYSDTGVVPAIAISSEYFPPEPVSDVSVICGDGKVNLSWTNPGDSDFSHVVISSKELDDIVVEGLPGEYSSVEINELENSKEYNFSIKAFDNTEYESSEITIKSLPKEINFETNVTILPSGTDGSLGTEGTYVNFGYWPQSLKSDDIIINTDFSYKIKKWTCYLGSDNNFYVKATADPLFDTNYEFDNGTKIERKEDYYFKLEPIKWAYVSDYQGGKLLLAEKALDVVPFDPDHYGMYTKDYEESGIRLYLNSLNGTKGDAEDYRNNGFISNAFAMEDVEKINTVDIGNSNTLTGEESYILEESLKCNDTKDKIFLLSEDELSGKNAFFNDNFYNISTTSPLIRKTTDYSRAMGAYSETANGFENNSRWWLRTPYQYVEDYWNIAGSKGDISAADKDAEGICIVPALVVSAKYFSPSDVKDVIVMPSDGKIKLSWTNPEDLDFEKVVISGFGKDDISVEGRPGEKTEKEITGLSNNKNYNVKITAFDSSNKTSKGVILDIKIVDINHTNNINILPKGTNGTMGPDGTYILFGDYPQSLKADNVKLDNTKYLINGNICYLGNDNCYYAEIKSDYVISNKNFNNGKKLKPDTYYYFKIEPIKWCVVSDNYQGGKLLMAENKLISESSANASDNYKSGNLRLYLNGYNGISDNLENFTGKGFIDTAFDNIGADRINKVSVYDDAYDKVFILPDDYVKSDNKSSDYSVVMETFATESNGIVPAITISPEYLPPSKVSNVDVVTSDGKVSVIWTNPEDSDFEYVLLSVTGCEKEIIKGSSGQTVTKEIDGLENNKKYSISLKAFDKYGDSSDEVYFETVPKQFNFTSKVRMLPGGITDGMDGKTGTYLLYGDWPQTRKSEDVVIGSNLYLYNKYSCYLGSDNCFYTLEKSKNGKNEYFKIEPIKWCMKTGEYKGGKLIKAENITISDDNVANSFIETAFTTENITKIKQTDFDKGVPALTISLKDIPPENIKHVNVNIKDDNTVLLTWTNPVDSDFTNVVISGTDSDDIIVKGNPGLECSKELNNLKKNKKYTITIKTEDKYGDCSAGNNVEVIIKDNMFATEVTSLPSKNGKKYVSYGLWPQFLKSESVTLYNPDLYSYNYNGWDCYLGNDNCYYVKEKAKPCKSNSSFNNGEKLVNGNYYYFKLEPITWRVVTNNYDGKNLLLSDDVLGAMEYYPSEEKRGNFLGKIHPNNYENSSLRAYLNGLDGSEYEVNNYNSCGFINKAFTQAEASKISKTEVDNKRNSMTDEGNNLKKSYSYDCGNTEDKIFLLSENEITSKDFGFDVYDSNDSDRCVKVCDYARALGTFYDEDNGNGCWWLRSPNGEIGEEARFINSNGSANNSSVVNKSVYGFVPAIVMEF